MEFGRRYMLDIGSWPSPSTVMFNISETPKTNLPGWDSTPLFMYGVSPSGGRISIYSSTMRLSLSVSGSRRAFGLNSFEIKDSSEPNIV